VHSQPAERIWPVEVAAFGAALSAVGLAFSFGLNLRFGTIVAFGFVFDLLVYALSRGVACDTSTYRKSFCFDLEQRR
jgi:heme O synthase-like polyprenyltransferase